MKAPKTTQLATINMLTHKASSHFSPRPFHASDDQQRVEQKENKTGLPDRLKAGIENLSGISLNDVKVHYNSDKPVHLQAYAYAQGTDIHLASGQEKHLHHEAWHIVQQKQGRVKPTLQMKGGVKVNDDQELEREADVMGTEALKNGTNSSVQIKENITNAPLRVKSDVVQQRALAKNKMNIAGETHAESDPIRGEERKYADVMTGGVYKTEGEFRTSKWALFGSDRLGDPMMLRVEMLLALLKEKTLVEILKPFGNKQIPPIFANVPEGDVETLWSIYREELRKQLGEIVIGLNSAIEEATEKTQAARAVAVHEALLNLYNAMPDSLVRDVQNDIIPEINRIIRLYAKDVLRLPDIRPENEVSAMRSTAMQEAAADNAARIIGSQVGVWKVGESHIQEIARDKQGDGYELLTKAEFNDGFNDWRAKEAARSRNEGTIG